MTQTEDQNFPLALLEKLFTQFLSAPNKDETTSEIPTQREMGQSLQALTPYPLFPISSSEYLYSATPQECYSCVNHSGSSYLKCAVNPARTIEQDCHQFELNALDWDSSEDNPANYSEN
jgi:hypothetical protein